MKGQRTVIWRDQYDSDQFFIGIKRNNEILKKYQYIVFGTVFVDGLADMFELSAEDIQSIKTVPIEVTLKLEFDDD